MSDPVVVMNSHFDFLRAQPAVARMSNPGFMCSINILSRPVMVRADDGSFRIMLLLVTASIDPGPFSHKIK